jgi:hypothetical protein
MSVPVLEALADAIYAFEGNKPTDRAYRNRNPGNRRESHMTDVKDAGGYCVFPTFCEGYTSLLALLHGMVTGQNAHGLSADSSLQQIFDVYAPVKDGNNPARYARFVAAQLRLAYIAPAISDVSTLRDLYQIAGEELPSGVTTT